MKLHRCVKCSMAYVFDDKVPGVREASDAVKCTRTYQRYSRSGLIGEFVEYCGGTLVPVTLEPDPSPVERDHGDRAQRADREGEVDAIERAALERARDREGIERARVARDRRTRWYHRNEYERDNALSGSRAAYWRNALALAPAHERVRAVGNKYFTEHADRTEAEARWKDGWASLVKATAGDLDAEGARLFPRSPDG